ncbi:MAG: formate dehydrogenase accessory protein FdhE [Steroidobacteraceae bacterium]
MAQRILEPGQIETLAKASIPRIRLPDRHAVFARRAARLRTLSSGAAIGDYLQFLAVLADAQHAALAQLSAPLPAPAHITRSGDYGMPPIHASTQARPQHWRETLQSLCTALAAHSSFPAGVSENIFKIRRADSAWIEDQAGSLLEARSGAVEASVAPIIMAALQVHWVALAVQFVADAVKALDVAGLCPLCGTLPVASIVCAQSPYQGYRYLHCALCATEWHMVRVQCSACGASGKDIGYHTLESNSAEKSPGAEGACAVRAETCEQCRGYRKIMYQEHDTGVDPVADDLASLSLDLLLGEQGYHRASGNPLLWMPSATAAS